MSFRNCLASSLCLLVLLCAASVSAQDEQLSDAITFADVAAYLSQGMNKLNAAGVADPKEDARIRAALFMVGSEKLMEVAENDMERRTAYSWKLNAFRLQVTAGIEGAEQKVEALLEEIAAHENPSISSFAAAYRFSQFNQRVGSTAPSRANFNALNDELKTWINQGNLPAGNIASVGQRIADRNRVPAAEFVKELTEFVQSAECTLPEEKKKELASALEGILRLAVGNDPKLYGRTLDDKEFKWESLREKDKEKYVLINFTATWCPPCQRMIPGMIETYEKYHDKGLEIVSVYMWQGEPDPVATVKNYVEEKKLPWIIISEELSKKAGLPEFGPHYNIQGVPTLVLVDKEGKIMMPATHGEEWRAKLAEIFEPSIFPPRPVNRQ